MKQNIIATLLFLFITISVSSQIVKSDETFTQVQTFDGKVVFLKEIKLTNPSIDKNYDALKKWGIANFGKDPANSSINSENLKKKITAKSRVELILPENSKGIRESVIMKYRIDSFFSDNMCILEITDISYINDKKANRNSLDQKTSAENIITDRAISIADENQETRINIRKNTLYFINDLTNSLQNALNN
ncbi:MAG: DUF4468 domain-containing protein [Dysgonomonas sp.]